MNAIAHLPKKAIADAGVLSKYFLDLGITGFQDACHYVHQMPYGFNSESDDLLILFKDGKGTCTSKHRVIAALAEEIDLPVVKTICLYAMTEEIVSGTHTIVERYELPYIPMGHCFLSFDELQIDLTEGNSNGKKRPIHEFLYTQTVPPTITDKEKYRYVREALVDLLLHREELKHTSLNTLLHAREEGIKLLRQTVRDAYGPLAKT